MSIVPTADGSLFDRKPQRTEAQQAFDEWAALNPDALMLFTRFAHELRNAGHAKGSARLILERIRWESHTGKLGPEFRINNNHAPHLARWLAEKDATFAGWFETRKAQGDAA